MTTITRIGRMVGNEIKNIDLSATGNILHAAEIKVGVSTNNLTATMLDNLKALQDGSDFSTSTNAHTHDGRYYTETELVSRTSASGASLVAVERKTYGNITGYTELSADSLANYNIQALMDAINTTLGTAGLTSFSDADFEIYNEAANTKKASFDVSAVAEGAKRVISVPNANVDLGKIATALQAGGSVAMTGNLNANGNKVTGLAAATANGDAVRYEQLQSVLSLINNFEWQESVIDRLATPPGSPTTGDRYLVIATADGDWSGQEDKIAEWDGDSWEFTSPATGMYVGVDDESDGLYLYGGSSWAKKYFEATTASTGLTKVGFDIRIADVNANGLQVSSGVFTVNVDGSTLERGAGAGNPLQIKDLGVTAAKLASDAVETLKIKDLNVTTGKLADDAVTKAKLNSDVAGFGLEQATDGSLDVRRVVVHLTNANASQLAAGTLVKISAANSFDVVSGNSISAAEGKIGILLATTDAAASGPVMVAGKAVVTVKTGDTLVGGEKLFLCGDDGKVSTTDWNPASSAGKASRRVGYAVNATEMILDVGMAIEIE